MRWFGVIVATGISKACFAGALGYLAVVGPAPLRMSEPLQAATFVLPPLVMGNEKATPAPKADVANPVEPETSTAQTNPIATTSTEPVEPNPGPHPTTTPTDTQPVPPLETSDSTASTPSLLVPSELFLRYFHPDGSKQSKEAVVVVPPEFIPPVQTVNPPRSTATYSSPAP